MTWFKVDDGFYDHPKVRALEDGPCFEKALALWLVAGSWCARYLTDGLVPHRQVTRFGIDQEAATELVRVRLWVVSSDGGYEFHQWAEHQPKRVDVERKRRVTAERVRKHRNGDTDSDSNVDGNGVTPPHVTPLHGQSNAVGNALPGIRARSPVPSRPDQGREEPQVPASGNAKSHPSRLIPLLDQATRTEAFKRNTSPSPSVLPQQAQKAAERAQELLDSGRCADAQEAVQALVEAAFEHAAATKGKYAFALLECTVAPKAEPFRTYIQPRGSV